MAVEEYQKLAQKLMEQNADRNKAFDAYADMYHMKWSLPAGLEPYDFIHKRVTSEPHDAIAAGVRVLSATSPKVKYMPLREDRANQKMAGERERNLLWHLKSANRKRPASVEADIVQSALMYSATAAMVVDLEWQMRMTKSEELKERLKKSRRDSRFVVVTYPPRDVYTRRSSLGLEGVLLVQKREAQEVMAEWGDKRLKEAAQAGKMVKYCDWMDHKHRCVWVEPADGGMDTIALMDGPHGLDFFPWVALMGGSTLEHEEEHKYHPMLYPIYQSESWDTVNALETLMVTEAIVQAFKKDVFLEGAANQSVEMDYTDPSGIAKLPAGVTPRQVQKSQVDQVKMQMIERLRGQIETSTVSRVLMTGEMSNADSFAALNLATQTATGALRPAKQLAEKTLAEIFTLMLMWAAKTGIGLDAYEKGGRRLRIPADEIATDAIYIECELTPDLPTDRLQRANTAAILVNTGMMSKQMAMEQQGIEDPALEFKKMWKERLIESKIGNIIQAEQMQVQMEGQAAQQQQQQEAQAQAEQDALAGQGGIPGGQGFNPAMGGMPPASAFPPGTREMLEGQDMMGNELAGGL